jgi:hypothetical protein
MAKKFLEEDFKYFLLGAWIVNNKSFWAEYNKTNKRFIQNNDGSEKLIQIAQKKQDVIEDGNNEQH